MEPRQRTGTPLAVAWAVQLPGHSEKMRAAAVATFVDAAKSGWGAKMARVASLVSRGSAQGAARSEAFANVAKGLASGLPKITSGWTDEDQRASDAIHAAAAAGDSWARRLMNAPVSRAVAQWRQLRAKVASAVRSALGRPTPRQERDLGHARTPSTSTTVSTTPAAGPPRCRDVVLCIAAPHGPTDAGVMPAAA